MENATKKAQGKQGRYYLFSAISNSSLPRDVLVHLLSDVSTHMSGKLKWVTDRRTPLIINGIHLKQNYNLESRTSKIEKKTKHGKKKQNRRSSDYFVFYVSLWNFCQNPVKKNYINKISTIVWNFTLFFFVTIIENYYLEYKTFF